MSPSFPHIEHILEPYVGLFQIFFDTFQIFYDLNHKGPRWFITYNRLQIEIVGTTGNDDRTRELSPRSNNRHGSKLNVMYINVCKCITQV